MREDCGGLWEVTGARLLVSRKFLLFFFKIKPHASYHVRFLHLNWFVLEGPSIWGHLQCRIISMRDYSVSSSWSFSIAGNTKAIWVVGGTLCVFLTKLWFTGTGLDEHSICKLWCIVKEKIERYFISLLTLFQDSGSNLSSYLMFFIYDSIQ